MKEISSLNACANPFAAEAFFDMKSAAEKDGLKLEIVSCYRSFEKQKEIWNAKYSGKRPLYDLNGNPLNFQDIDPKQLINTILYWSALPGASRHHWGTDMDVIDISNLPKDYNVQLLPAEFAEDGVFGVLDLWLDQRMKKYGFFRPYAEYKGGVCVEPWHISFSPVSESLLNEMAIEYVQEAISEGDIFGKEMILEQLPELYEKFVINICRPQ